MATSVVHILLATCAVIALLLAAKTWIAPPIMRAILGAKPNSPRLGDWRDRVEMLYQPLHTYVWMFAWHKLRLDRMFDELPVFLKNMPAPRTALDLGCGFGVAGCSMLDWYPGLTIYGVDPSRGRVRAASQVFGQRGKVFQSGAPDFEMEGMPDRFDLVMVLDVVHFLTDEQFALTLRRIQGRLNPGGWLILRAPMLPNGAGSFTWKVDRLQRRLKRTYACYRTIEQIRKIMIDAGFEIDRAQQSGESCELFWFIASAPAPAVCPSSGFEQLSQTAAG